jgi:hypothetical protein
VQYSSTTGMAHSLNASSILYGNAFSLPCQLFVWYVGGGLLPIEAVVPTVPSVADQHVRKPPQRSSRTLTHSDRVCRAEFRHQSARLRSLRSELRKTPVCRYKLACRQTAKRGQNPETELPQPRRSSFVCLCVPEAHSSVLA